MLQWCSGTIYHPLAILLVPLVVSVSAQNHDPSSSSPIADAEAITSEPTDTMSDTSDQAPGGLSSSTLASTLGTTPSSSSSPSEPSDDGHRDGLLNYYFLLLGILIFIICMVYYLLIRKRRMAHKQSQKLQSNALSQDLRHQIELWQSGPHGDVGTVRRWGIGRSNGNGGDGGDGRNTRATRIRRNTWDRRSSGDSRNTTSRADREGLNEEGEAPPPYLQEPARAHLDSRSDDLELGDWSHQQRGKLPDYDEHAARPPG